MDKYDFSDVRINELIPLEEAIEIDTPTIYFTNSTVEKCIQAVEKLGIKHISLGTDSIDFLDDKRLNNIKGIYLNDELKNIRPLFKFNNLTHLGLSDSIKDTFDFSFFPNLIYLSGQFPKRYVNFEALKSLKYTYLFQYNKPDFSDFSDLNNLRKIEIYSVNSESLEGLSQLAELQELILDKCPKLVSVKGLSKNNSKLEWIRLLDCKKLKDCKYLGHLPNLKHLQLYKINQINSFDFLNSLTSLERIYIHPSNTGVLNNDYYPLIEKLKELDLIDNLKGWKPLKDYLNREVRIIDSDSKNTSELSLILDSLSVRNWTEKLENGLDIYTVENCDRAINIFSDLINKLETSKNKSIEYKVNLIKESVLSLNRLNEELGGGFIETREREELCSIFDNIADSIGINVQDFGDDIAYQWRNW